MNSTHTLSPEKKTMFRQSGRRCCGTHHFTRWLMYSCVPHSKTVGQIFSCVFHFLHKSGRQMTVATVGVSQTAFIFQRVSVVIQRYNSVRLHIFWWDGLLAVAPICFEFYFQSYSSLCYLHHRAKYPNNQRVTWLVVTEVRSESCGLVIEHCH